MSNKNAIYRAAKNSHTPTLPAGFQERLAARIEKQRRREEALDKIKYGVTGVFALSFFVASIVVLMQKLEFDWSSLELDFNTHLPTLEPANWQHAKHWGSIAALLCAMLTLDCYIRHLAHLRQLKKENENKDNS